MYMLLFVFTFSLRWNLFIELLTNVNIYLGFFYIFLYLKICWILSAQVPIFQLEL